MSRRDGKVVLVTGAGSGIGLAAATGVRAVACDVSGVADLRRFVAEFAGREDRLDVLVNNAGVMPDEREQSVLTEMWAGRLDGSGVHVHARRRRGRTPWSGSARPPRR